MVKKAFWLSLFILVFTACQITSTAVTPTSLPTPTPTSTESALDVPAYPLADGAYWVYQGQVAYQQEGGVVEETIEWRVEVVESVDYPSVTGYLMRGSLDDLAFYAPGKEPSSYAIIQVGSNRFYRADLDTYNRLKTEDDFHIGLVSEHNLILELPLETGNRFCEAEQITRLDGGYCWVVGEPETVTFAFLPGRNIQAYPISFSTNPDQTLIYFAPGIGIAAFRYHHSGSASDVQMALIEYSLGNESQ